MTTTPDQPADDSPVFDEVAHAAEPTEEISQPDSDRFVDGDLEDEH